MFLSSVVEKTEQMLHAALGWDVDYMCPPTHKKPIASTHTQTVTHAHTRRYSPGERVSSRSTEPKACSRCLLSLATLTPPELDVDPTFSFTTAWDVDAAARGVGGAGAGGWLAGAAVGAGVSGCSSGTEGVTSIGSENGIPGRRGKSVTDIEHLNQLCPGLLITACSFMIQCDPGPPG